MKEAQTSWTLDDLQENLKKFERELRAAGLKPNSIHTYVHRTSIFLRWLTGEYQPHGPRQAAGGE